LAKPKKEVNCNANSEDAVKSHPQQQQQQHQQQPRSSKRKAPQPHSTYHFNAGDNNDAAKLLGTTKNRDCGGATGAANFNQESKEDEAKDPRTEEAMQSYTKWIILLIVTLVIFIFAFTPLILYMMKVKRTEERAEQMIRDETDRLMERLAKMERDRQQPDYNPEIIG